MAADHIVEVYSAANVLEAHALRDVLAEAGIETRVVGEEMSAGAGAMSLGQETAPRIWVAQGDEERAREIVAEWESQPHEEETAADSEDQADAEETPAEEDEPQASDDRFAWVSGGFYVLAAICIVAGAVWAWRNGNVLQQHSGVAEGELVDRGATHKWVKPPPGAPGTPVPEQWGSLQKSFYAYYAYTVAGNTYYAGVQDASYFPEHVQIRYDPDDPDNKVVGPITPPGIVLAFALGIAAFLGFVGYQFR